MLHLSYNSHIYIPINMQPYERDFGGHLK